MTENKVVLDTAAFLDSAASRALSGVARKDQQAILERFLRCVYEEAGKAPEHLDGDDVHSILGHLLPGHFERKDPLAAHVKAVLAAYLDHLEEHVYVPQLPQLRLALEWTAEEFEETVRTEGSGSPSPSCPSRIIATTRSRS